ncbi:MAG: lipocalin-like domain-containing protein [Myxococcota bacterium]
MDVTGSWALQAWRRYNADGTTSHPFGESPQGLLIYSACGHMAVQMVAAERPNLDTDDALGGTESERAQAYSSCLAYFGRYRVEDQSIVHEIEGSLFPNWTNTAQVRPLRIDGNMLILQVVDAAGRTTNDIVWRREGR